MEKQEKNKGVWGKEIKKILQNVKKIRKKRNFDKKYFFIKIEKHP